MSNSDFDLDQLAAFLHLGPQQVARLADRGKVPGRKVGGQWRFSQAEIHHWLEERIGLSDDEGLAQVESVLERSAGAGEQQPTVAEMLLIDAIAVPLAARTRGSVITSMVGLAEGTGLLWDARKMSDAVRAREDMQPTALDSGVALLHPRRPLPNILGQEFLALGRTSQGIPFGNRGGLTDIFFLICSVSDHGHLRTLARLSRLLSDPEVLAAIRQATDPRELHCQIVERESQLAD